ncbi:hypothetical protein KKH39_01545 [Patescibacteria group bacterium]|nr:hypothetical protein [Patescibacteria group bacterium]
MKVGLNLNLKESPMYVKILAYSGLIISVIASLAINGSDIFQLLGGIIGILFMTLILEIIPYLILKKKIKNAHGTIFSILYAITAILTLIGSFVRN